MAKEKEVPTMDQLIYLLVGEVGCGILSAHDASQRLRKLVDALDEKEKTEFREKALGRAGTIMQVAELFKQELTLIGAGQ